MRCKLKSGLLLVLVALTVASCGTLGKKKVYPCPKLYVLADAGKLVRFKPGPGRDITDILFEGTIADFTGTCEYDEKKGVDIDLQTQIELRRGPASTDRAISFEYFVAIPSFRPQPEGKRVLPVTGRFEGPQTRLIYQDEIKMFIPLAKPTDGEQIEIVIGFQLRPEEIEFNRAMKTR